MKRDLGFFFSAVKFSPLEISFPSGADISILNVFIFRKLKLAMSDSFIMGKAISLLSPFPGKCIDSETRNSMLRSSSAFKWSCYKALAGLG